MTTTIQAIGNVPRALLDPACYRDSVAALRSRMAADGLRDVRAASAWYTAQGLGRDAEARAKQIARTFATDAVLAGTPAGTNEHRLRVAERQYSPIDLTPVIPQSAEPTPLGRWTKVAYEMDGSGAETRIGFDGATGDIAPISLSLSDEQRIIVAHAVVVEASVFEDSTAIDIPGMPGVTQAAISFGRDVVLGRGLNRRLAFGPTGGGAIYGIFTHPGVPREIAATANLGTTGQARVTAFSEALTNMRTLTDGVFAPNTCLISDHLAQVFETDTYSATISDSTMEIIERKRFPGIQFVRSHTLNTVTVGGVDYYAIVLFDSANAFSLRRDVVVEAQPLPVQDRAYSRYYYMHTIDGGVDVRQPASCYILLVPKA